MTIGEGTVGGVPVQVAAQRAMDLYRAGRRREALDLCRAISAQHPERADVYAFAGQIAAELGAYEEAARLYRSAAERRPAFVQAHYNLGNMLRRLGRGEEALAAYRRALALRPDLAPVHNNLGSLLREQGRLAEAAEAYQRALQHAPRAAEAHRNLGLVYEQMGRLEEAAGSYRHAIELRPEATLAYSNLAAVLLDLERTAEALGVCEKWLQVEPASIEGLAYKCVLLNELGRTDARDFLLDFERFVRVRELQAPAGFASIAELNRALAAHICAHPTLRVPPPSDPTYHHPKLQITDELLVEPKGPVGALEGLLHAEIEHYRRSVAARPPHPWLAAWPERWHLAAWAVVLDGAGNLVPHIHLDGYLGGSYYVEVPDVVRGSESGEAGWFELGRAPEEMRTKVESATRRIQPAPGRLILFPGYFYHATVPFVSSQRRITFAFDLVPDE